MKRTCDVLASTLLLILLSPVFLAIAICVRLCMGAPVFFRQERSGLFGQPFTLTKFRTMAIGVDSSPKDAYSDDKRLTQLGRLLRTTSLDELPELLNVLRGEMSLVGPRPLLPDYLPLYSDQQSRRHEVRPGITGWAQVNGRNAVTWEKKFELDVWYVDHHSFLLDARIIWMTFWQVLFCRGIRHGGHATMPRFTGSHPTQTGGVQDDG
jgi:sugar transferase EpsL